MGGAVNISFRRHVIILNFNNTGWTSCLDSAVVKTSNIPSLASWSVCEDRGGRNIFTVSNLLGRYFPRAALAPLEGIFHWHVVFKTKLSQFLRRSMINIKNSPSLLIISLEFIHHLVEYYEPLANNSSTASRNRSVWTDSE